MHSDFVTGKLITGVWSDQTLLETVNRPLKSIRKSWTVL